MKLHRLLAYGLMVGGAVASVGAIRGRARWEQMNVRVGIMLDWDDVQAAATRALSPESTAHLLNHLRAHGATHLSLPELTLNRLLERGELRLAEGEQPERIYLRAQRPQLAERVTTELRARLPHLAVTASRAKNPLISFVGDLPSVAEIGLGFDPAHFALAHETGLAPVARPIGYSWLQPAMIERTLSQAAELGAKIVAVRGSMTPGFEFNLAATIEAMKQNRLCYAYFRESRQQRGDWYMAKSLAEAGQVILAHEFEPEELLLEDAGTISRRWANLAVEGGVRLCCLRFFRLIHAGDPMEALDYVSQLAGALKQAGLEISPAPDWNVPAKSSQGEGGTNRRDLLPERSDQGLALAGLSIAGAAGLAADLLPLPDTLKLLGTGLGAAALAYLPFLERARTSQPGEHNHHSHHHHHQMPEADHHHHHAHGHSHSHPYDPKTAYVSKGLALAAAMVYPAAAAAGNGAAPLLALAQAATASAAGAISLHATLAEADYLLGVEEYRGYQLDWLVPLTAGAFSAFSNLVTGPAPRYSGPERWRWLPLAGVVLMALSRFGHRSGGDPLARWDREHRYAHTHHISTFQQLVGDAKMALSPQPLRKWSLLLPMGAVGAAIFKQQGQDSLAAGASMVAALGGAATITGFRNMQRPFQKTAAGRARGWLVGLGLAGLVWSGSLFFNKRPGHR